MRGLQSLRGLKRSLRESNRGLVSSTPSYAEASNDPVAAAVHGYAPFREVRKPEKSGTSDSGASRGQQEGGYKNESSTSKIGWVIPVLGIPGLAGWFWYDQIYLQQEHEKRIQSQHERILEQRQRMSGHQTPVQQLPRQHQPAVPQEVAKAGAAASVGQKTPGSEDRIGGGNNREGPSKTAAAGGAAAGAPESDAQEEGRGKRVEEQGVSIMSAVGALEEQEQKEAESTARDAQVAQEAAKALEQQQQREQQDRAQHEREQREQQEREQKQREEEEQWRLQKLLQGVESAAAQHAAAFGYEYQPAQAKGMDAVLPAIPKGRMGVQVDLSPAGLIQFAIERKQELGIGSEDWDSFKARHGQAAADAEAFARAAQQIASWHEAEVALVQSIADKHAARVKEVTEMAKASTESFKRLLKQHQEMATELRNLEVRQAERRVVLAARKALEEERKSRAEALDAVRQQLGALACAHDARASQQSASRLSHAITLAVLDASAALESGSSLAPHLHALLAAAQLPHAKGTSQAMVACSNADSDATRTAAAGKVDATLNQVEKQAQEGGKQEATSGDGAWQQLQEHLALEGTVGSASGVAAVEEVVAAAVGSMPSRVAAHGVATTQQLNARLHSLHSVISQLAMLPLAAQAQNPSNPAATADSCGSSRTKSEVAPCPGLVGGGGILAHAVARLAAWLKVDETKAVQALGPQVALSQGSVEAALAVAKAQLAEGKLAAAADTLTTATAGTEAAAAVAAWCEEARERAVADQALRMLRAHATTLAASVV